MICNIEIACYVQSIPMPKKVDQLENNLVPIYIMTLATQIIAVQLAADQGAVGYYAYSGPYNIVQTITSKHSSSTNDTPNFERPLIFPLDRSFSVCGFEMEWPPHTVNFVFRFQKNRKVVMWNYCSGTGNSSWKKGTRSLPAFFGVKCLYN